MFMHATACAVCTYVYRLHNSCSCMPLHVHCALLCTDCITHVHACHCMCIVHFCVQTAGPLMFMHAPACALCTFVYRLQNHSCSCVQLCSVHFCVQTADHSSSYVQCAHFNIGVQVLYILCMQHGIFQQFLQFILEHIWILGSICLITDHLFIHDTIFCVYIRYKLQLIKRSDPNLQFHAIFFIDCILAGFTCSSCIYDNIYIFIINRYLYLYVAWPVWW